MVAIGNSAEIKTYLNQAQNVLGQIDGLGEYPKYINSVFTAEDIEEDTRIENGETTNE